jgi:hypothetical protein
MASAVVPNQPSTRGWGGVTPFSQEVELTKLRLPEPREICVFPHAIDHKTVTKTLSARAIGVDEQGAGAIVSLSVNHTNLQSRKERRDYGKRNVNSFAVAKSKCNSFLPINIADGIRRMGRVGL